MADKTERVANPEQGYSFGLDLPFMYRQEDPDRWVVYGRKDGEVVASFDGSEAFPEALRHNLFAHQRAFWARELAYQDCFKRNKAGVDLAAIDSTP